jgi:iron complex outermembrane receptor protein
MRFIKSQLRQVPLAAALLASTLTLPQLALAQTSVQAVAIHIPAQPAGSALKAFVEQTKFQLIYAPEIVQGLNTKAVSGNFTPAEALASLLEGTDVNIVTTGGNAATLQKKPAPATTASLDTVIVTARKKDERMIDVPIAMSAMTGESLRRRGASSVVDVLQDAPGVSVIEGGTGSGMAQISIRGIATGLGGNVNGYYLNDVPFTGVTVPFAPDVRAWDLDRIEILRGPQGTLFGEGSMGGTIRILTNRPKFGEFSFGGQLTGSSTAGGSGSNGQMAMVNVPLGEMLAVRIAATHESLGGWIDDAATNSKDVNLSKIDTGRMAVAFEPTDRLRIDAKLPRPELRHR